MVTIISPSRYSIAKKKLQQYARDALQHVGLPSDYGVTIVFVGTRKMKEFAKTYKKSSTAHPVLTFDYSQSESMPGERDVSGEIVICYPQAVLLATERDKTVDDTLLQLVEHGIQNLVK